MLWHSNGNLWDLVPLAALPVLDLGIQNPQGTPGDAVPQFPCLSRGLLGGGSRQEELLPPGADLSVLPSWI